MRIVEIRTTDVPIQSSIRNSYIDFSKMTLSLVPWSPTSRAMAAALSGWIQFQWPLWPELSHSRAFCTASARSEGGKPTERFRL